MAGRDVVVLHGDETQGYESFIRLIGAPNGAAADPRVSMANREDSTGNGTLIRFLPGIKGMITIWDSDLQLVLYCDSATAATFHAPVLPGKADDPFREYWGIGSNTSILVGGAHLVRTATFEDGILALQGDIQGETMLQLVGVPASTRQITWNGMEFDTIASVGSSPSITTGFVPPRVEVSRIESPVLDPWKYQDSLPEIKEDFSDSHWVQANNYTTNSPYKPWFGDGPVLYACDYGFCEGAVLWRGIFNSAENGIKGVRLVINGGEGMFSGGTWPRINSVASFCRQCLDQRPLPQNNLWKVSPVVSYSRPVSPYTVQRTT
jgi:Beta-galactosidase, domain 3/Beta-galactosidase jelly roll domain